MRTCYDICRHSSDARLANVATQLVGDFELLEFLASGTVGDVYRGRHRTSGQLVVIKFLQADVAGEPEVQRRFVREVSIAEKLNHPNIVRHFDCGLFDDRIFFAMELVECGTLKDVLHRRGQLPWREVVECGIQICRRPRIRPPKRRDPSRSEALQLVPVRKRQPEGRRLRPRAT